MPKPRHAPAEAPVREAKWYWTQATYVLLALVAIIMLWTVGDYGITWDEFKHDRYGAQVLSWYTSVFQDRSAIDDAGLYIYLGAAFDLPATIVANALPLDRYFARHLLGVLVASLGFWYAARLGALVAGPRGGFFALLFLVLTPRFYGHAFNNPKDIPLAVVTCVALFYLVRFVRGMPKPTWKDAVLFGVAAGIALGLRIVSLALFLYLVVALVAWLLPWLVEQRRDGRDAKALLRGAFTSVPQLACSVAVAAVIMYASWPAAQVSPVGHLLRTLRKTSDYSRAFPVLWDGQLLNVQDLPGSYVPRWMSLSLPETYAVALLALGLVLLTVGPRRLVGGTPRWLVIGFGVLVLSVGFPVGTQILKGAMVYDGWRHFLFVVPPLAVLAGASVATLWHGGVPVAVRRVVLGVAGIAVALTASDSWRMHPYQSIYFNRIIAGGLAGATGKFETEYWGTSYKEGAEWIQSHYAPGDSVITVGSCGHPLSTEHFLRRPGFDYLGSLDQDLVSAPQVFVATNRWRCADRLPGREVHRVTRLGAPILFIKEIPPGTMPSPAPQGRSGEGRNRTVPGDTSVR